MNRILTLLAIVLIGLPLSAQESSNTLEDQFTDVIDNSNRYQDYKVVKIYKLNALRTSVLDSISALEGRLQSASDTISSKDGKISSLSLELDKTKLDLAESRKKEDGISLFGMLLNKGTYNMIMWSLVALLLLVLGLNIVRFNRSNSVTRSAHTKLTEVEEEYEDYRQRMLEREQQLRRKLQDEINKQKK